MVIVTFKFLTYLLAYKLQEDMVCFVHGGEPSTVLIKAFWAFNKYLLNEKMLNPVRYYYLHVIGKFKAQRSEVIAVGYTIDK